MTTTFPDGSVDSLAVDPSGDPSASIDFADIATMAALASAYQLAQHRLSASAERASSSLWAAQRPLTDAQLSSWMSSWDALLAGQAQQQAALTAAYSRTMLARFGVRLPAPSLLSAPDTATEWLDSPYGRLASSNLRSQVQRAQEAASAGRASVAEAARLDRISWLHSPVVKNRWHVSEGVAFDQSVLDVVPFTQGAAYDAGRAAERLAMSAYTWPTFKNGVAMLYMRVPQAGACGWCRLVATRLYSLQSFRSGAAWHVRCRCSWSAVPYESARRYADTLAASEGDYYAAATQIGTWTGPAPASYTSVLAERAARTDATTPLTAAERATLDAQRANATGRTRSTSRQGAARTTAPVANPLAEAQAAALVAQANALNARARAAFAAGDSAESKRLYNEAAQLTAQALRLRTAR